MGEPEYVRDAVGAKQGQGQETSWLCQGHTEAQVDPTALLPPDCDLAASVF